MSIRNAAARQASRLANDPAANKVGRAVEKTKPAADEPCAFSFRFFKEIENFGLDAKNIDKAWPMSFLYRLQELSKMTVVDLTENRAVMEGTLRIHDIDWNGKNTPIKRKDLDWIDSVYLGNSEEFPIIQIAVSKAMGRMVGFFDEKNHFQIVLLDPLHNAQPSKYNEYKVRFCKPLGCELTTVRSQAASAIQRIKGRTCSCAEDLSDSLEWIEHATGGAVVIASLDERLLRDASDIMQMGAAESHAEIFQSGIEVLLEKSMQPPQSSEASSGGNPCQPS